MPKARNQPLDPTGRLRAFRCPRQVRRDVFFALPGRAPFYVPGPLATPGKQGLTVAVTHSQADASMG